MEKSGFVAVGHLLENKSPDGYFQAMRHFCTVMFCSMDEKLIYKSSGYWRFDQFFSSVEVNIESFGKFVTGILRRPDADFTQLQLQIERIVWDWIKCDFDGFVAAIDDLTLFRLFCLFNRFCRRDVIPMTLHNRAAVFICKELGVPTTVDPAPAFKGLLKHVAVYAKTVPGVAKAVKRMYDEFVRDIIKEGRVQFRVIDDTFGSIIHASKIKTHAVTSRHLIIYEDTDDVDQPHATEPAGKVLHKIPLIDVGARPVNGLFGKSKRYLELVRKSRANPSIEMAFAADKDSYDLFSWNQAIQEAVYCTRINATRLTKAYTKLGLGQSSVTASLSKHRHSSDLDMSGEQPRERFYSSGDLTKVELPTDPRLKQPPPSPPRKIRNDDGGEVSPLLRRALLVGGMNKQDKDRYFPLGAEDRKDTVVPKGKIGDSNTSRRP